VPFRGGRGGEEVEVAYRRSTEHVVGMVAELPEAIKLRGVTCQSVMLVDKGTVKCEGSSIIFWTIL